MKKQIFSCCIILILLCVSGCTSPSSQTNPFTPTVGRHTSTANPSPTVLHFTPAAQAKVTFTGQDTIPKPEGTPIPLKFNDFSVQIERKAFLLSEFPDPDAFFSIAPSDLSDCGSASGYIMKSFPLNEKDQSADTRPAGYAYTHTCKGYHIVVIELLHTFQYSGDYFNYHVVPFVFYSQADNFSITLTDTGVTHCANISGTNYSCTNGVKTVANFHGEFQAAGLADYTITDLSSA